MSEELLTRRVAKILPDRASLEKIMDNKKIRLYQGFDPTATRLHLGHSVGLRKLMDFAEAGHEVIFLFGTGTVLVGDPSLRDTARTLITEEEINRNITDWKSQTEKIIDFSKVKVMKNGDWLTKLSIKDIIHIGSKISAVQLFKRESFTRRIERGDTVWYHETLYPLLQGYDSVAMDADLEIGGTDQEFNMLVGRELQRKMNNREKWVLTTPMIVGTDGNPMSKTTGNCVWLDDKPEDMFGKLMRLPDEHIWSYMELVTNLPLQEIETLKGQKLNPRDAKAHLAREVVTMYYDPTTANMAEEQFERLFSSKSGPTDEDMVEKILDKSDWTVDDLLVTIEAAPSKSQARRLLEQGSIKLNGKKLDSENVALDSSATLQVGKRKFYKLHLK
jgi:tyrosyl-tRNA synthetase